MISSLRRPRPWGLRRRVHTSCVAAVACAVVGSVAPSHAAPTPVAPTRLAPETGTLVGTVQLLQPNADNGEPVWKGACADLRVVATPLRGLPVRGSGAGNIETGTCGFTLKLLPGSYRVALELDGKSVAPAQPTFAVRAREATRAALKADWPTLPTGVVKGSIDTTGNSFAPCSSLRVKVVHAARTFERTPLQEAGGRCSFHFNWIPLGPVAVSVAAQLSDAPPLQQATLAADRAVVLGFEMPKYGTLRVRARPAAYPAKTPGLQCGSYVLVVKRDGAVLEQKPFAGVDLDCSAQTLAKLPPGVPITWELLKSGVVARSATVVLTPAQFLEQIVTPLP